MSTKAQDQQTQTAASTGAQAQDTQLAANAAKNQQFADQSRSTLFGTYNPNSLRPMLQKISSSLTSLGLRSSEPITRTRINTQVAQNRSSLTHLP